MNGSREPALRVSSHALERTLEERGLDFEDAPELFAGVVVQIEDDRRDYGEPRYQTIGRLKGQVVMVVWTPRGAARRIISMRLCNAEERQLYQGAVG